MGLIEHNVWDLRKIKRSFENFVIIFMEFMKFTQNRWENDVNYILENHLHLLLKLLAENSRDDIITRVDESSGENFKLGHIT